MAEVEAVQIIAESLKQQVRQRAVDGPSFFWFSPLSLCSLWYALFVCNLWAGGTVPWSAFNCWFNCALFAYLFANCLLNKGQKHSKVAQHCYCLLFPIYICMYVCINACVCVPLINIVVVTSRWLLITDIDTNGSWYSPNIPKVLKPATAS